jgi:hypothetical protein
MTNLSLSKIGKHFGNRDHSTVLHAIKRIKERIEKEPEIKDEYELLKLKSIVLSVLFRLTIVLSVLFRLTIVLSVLFLLTIV